VHEEWYREAVIYCLDVDTFQDSNGDGVGDLPGLISRLDYLSRLGVTCLWLTPIHPSPRRDDGYDVTDYYAVHPDIGSLGDFVELVHQADNRGMRVMIDLVINHTSDEHPWFVDACSGRDARHRDWYVWSDEEPADAQQGMVFPGAQDSTWTYDDEAGAWYYHRFYDFQPDLDMANADVRAEIDKIIGFWLKLGVSGFRLDAAPFVIELTTPNAPNPRKDFDWLTQFRRRASWRRGDSVILAEANVDRDELPKYFGDGDRLPMLFNFMLNARTFLALARADAAPIVHALAESPTVPPTCQWATFLRNNDEVDLSQLVGREREDVFAAFGPEPEMQLYGRGIRRRLATMLGNDRRRIEMAYALQFALPGTPVIRYGDEIGMGDDMSLPQREAIRTAMQWSAEPNGGFSRAKTRDLRAPVIESGEYGYESVNVLLQQRDDDSLLSWFSRALHTLRECPEFGTGTCRYVDTGVRSVVALVRDAPGGTMLALTNLAPEACTVDVGPQPEASAEVQEVHEVFADSAYEPPTARLEQLELAPYGYRWIRLRQAMGR
jgi:maltose alpha-D-glucosyltransferase/alpha-amylase